MISWKEDFFIFDFDSIGNWFKRANYTVPDASIYSTQVPIPRFGWNQAIRATLRHGLGRRSLIIGLLCIEPRVLAVFGQAGVVSTPALAPGRLAPAGSRPERGASVRPSASLRSAHLCLPVLAVRPGRQGEGRTTRPPRARTEAESAPVPRSGMGVTEALS